MTDNILYDEYMDGKWKKACHCNYCNCIGLYCEAVYEQTGERISCGDAFGTQICKKSAYKAEYPVVVLPEMLFPEGDIKTLPKWALPERSMKNLLEYLQQCRDLIGVADDLLRPWETYCADGHCSYKNLCEFIDGDCPVLKFINYVTCRTFK